MVLCTCVVTVMKQRGFFLIWSCIERVPSTKTYFRYSSYWLILPNTKTFCCVNSVRNFIIHDITCVKLQKLCILIHVRISHTKYCFCEMTWQLKSQWMKENITKNLWVRFQTIFKGIWKYLWIAIFILPACALLILAIFM